MPESKTHHMNTLEGRRAASEARLRWVEERPDVGEPAVYVVRLAGVKPYSWEIRKYGGIVLRSSEIGFETQSMARAAGEEALADMLDETS